MTRALRIILDYRPALRERTGVGEYVHEMALALAVEARRAGDRLTAFSSSWKDRLNPAELPGIEVVDARVPVSVLNLAWHRLQWPPVERFTGAADIAHSAHPLLMPTTGAARVVTIHDLDFLDHPERTGREIRRDYPTLARDHARRADLVVVSSRHTAAQIAAGLDVPGDRIALCPAGAPAWEARPAPPRPGYFLFVGTLEPRKNIGRLLDAYERLLARHPDAPPLWLAGRVQKESSEWLARVGRAPLAGRVTYLGYIASSDKRDLYAGALALLVPSLYEGFGLTALEAMTVGVPVIASRRGSLPELLGQAAVEIDPEDSASISHAMASVWKDASLARRLSESGLARAAAFSWSASASVLLDAYRSALARRRARS
jgi:glycosyltransferase involved in cell wall biosynthesis